MEGHCSTGQSPQWAVVPVEGEGEEELYYTFEIKFVFNSQYVLITYTQDRTLYRALLIVYNTF